MRGESRMSMYGEIPGILSIYGFQDGSVSILGGTSSAAPSGSGRGYTLYYGPGSIPGTGPTTYTGPGSTVITPTLVCDDFDFTAQIAQLEALIESLYILIESLFPPETAMSSFIAEYTVPARLNPYTYVRFAWIKENPGKKLYPSRNAALEIMEIYLKNGLDWTQDPLILRYPGSS